MDGLTLQFTPFLMPIIGAAIVLSLLAAYAARRALALDPALAPELDPILEQAERQFEFKRMFDRGRWDNGLDLTWEERMDLLRACLRKLGTIGLHPRRQIAAQLARAIGETLLQI